MQVPGPQDQRYWLTGSWGGLVIYMFTNATGDFARTIHESVKNKTLELSIYIYKRQSDYPAHWPASTYDAHWQLKNKC